MPCNMVATIQTRLDTSPKLILDTAAGLAAAQAVIAQMFNVQAKTITVHGDKLYDWWKGYNQSDHKNPTQGTSLAELAAANQKYIDFGFFEACVRIYRDGRVEVRNGWNTSRNIPQVTANELQGKLNGMLGALSGLVAQARARAALAAQFKVTEETRTQAGAVVMTLEI